MDPLRDSEISSGGALDGRDISAPAAMPSGGWGIRGWLSAIWTKVNGTIVTSNANLDEKLSDVIDTRKQTPTKTKSLLVQIGPGDVISNLPVVIEYDHHQIHEGETWQYQSFGTLNAATRDIRISVPALTATTRTPHLIPEVICDCTSATLYLYEGTTWTAGGTDDSANIRNRNRNVTVPAVPNTKIYIAGGTALTVNALGTLIWNGYIFTNKAASIADRMMAEWDLAASKEYLFRVTTVGNGTCLIRLHFYEDLGV